MATRRVIPQHVRGDPVGAKNAAAKNRRALGDIGNIASLPGGVEGGKINRPLTRNFRAQLLENAHVAVAANRKQINVDNKAPILDGAKVVVPKKPEAVVRAVQKNARAVKRVPLKPIEVILISPDTNEVAKAKEEKKNDASRKKVTYTSVLNARSKAASKTLDIDSVDKGNDLAAVEYVEDMYTFYKEVENESKPQMYMHTQPEINEKMRSILIDWLVDVHIKFELSPETLYLTINIVDRFLSLKTVPRRELRLVGVSALLIASKYADIWPPQVNDLLYVTDTSYNNKQILVMEKTILGDLEWYLTVPTQYVFIVRFIIAAIPDPETENTVHFLAEFGMMHSDTWMFCPSMLAASEVYTARYFLNKTPAWTDTLKFHTGYNSYQLMDCSKLLAFIHSRVGESKLHAVFRKYLKPKKQDTGAASVPGVPSLESCMVKHVPMLETEVHEARKRIKEDLEVQKYRRTFQRLTHLDLFGSNNWVSTSWKRWFKDKLKLQRIFHINLEVKVFRTGRICYRKNRGGLRHVDGQD